MDRELKRFEVASIELISKIERLIKTSYIVITDLEKNVSWVSEEMGKFFGVKAGLVEDFFEIFYECAHPYDIDELKRNIKERLQLQELGVSCSIRLRHDVKDIPEYVLFTITSDVVCVQGDYRYLVTVMRNDKIPPEIDYVTILFGKKRFLDDIEKTMNSGLSVATIMVSLDNIGDLKIIYGENSSDTLFEDVALRFIYMMDENKAIYRINETGFVFILKDVDREFVYQYADEIKNILENQIVFQGRQMLLKCSMAALMLDSFEGSSDTIQGRLEFAVEISREKHRGDLVFFDDIVKINNNVNLDLIKVIHQSVQRDCEGFYVEYQPIVESSNGKIVGAEALVRWKKEPYGIVPPGMFIEWMERNSSMFEVGNFVLKTALMDLKEFVKHDPEFFVNVNVSARQLERKEFKTIVIDELKKSGVSPKNLCLEITERCKDLPLEVLCEEIEFFQGQGIRVALDDYGTGSASASLLLNLPVDEIKLDMSFVRGILDDRKKQLLLKKVIAFANDAGILSCVEGIENEEIQDYLRPVKSTWFQGYYYSKPISASAIIDFME